MDTIPIEFLISEEFRDRAPPPYPASQAIPEWYKNIPPEVVVYPDLIPTIKVCPPFGEAMMAGYIIPLMDDVQVKIDSYGQLQAIAQEKALQLHMPAQYQNSPFEKFPVLKFINPWLIRTPPGYSTLFVEPFNRFAMPIHPLPGLVETDLFYREVNIPTVVTLKAGSTFLLPKGTPLVQVIPLKREQFKAQFGIIDAERRASALKELADNPHFYKENHWRKKKYD